MLLERATRWLLRNRPRPLDIAATIARYAPGAAALAEALPALLGPSELEARAARPRRARRGAVCRRSSRERVATSSALVAALDIVEIAAPAELTSPSAAEVYFALGARLELHWLRDRIVDLPRETRWDAMARAALRDDVYAEQAGLTAEVVRTARTAAAGSGRAWHDRERERGRALASGDRRTSAAAARSTSPGCPSPCGRSAT